MRVADRKMNIKTDFAKYYTDIECRIVRCSKDGRSGLVKLFRNGMELPTRRNVWIEFLLINNADTHYNVAGLKEVNGKAYDVIICDDKGIVYYNGELKRERQTWCAQKFGQPIPDDTLELEAYWQKQREYRKAHPIESIHIDPWDKMSISTHKWVKSFVDRHPDMFDKPSGEMTNKDIYDAYWYIRDLGYGS